MGELRSSNKTLRVAIVAVAWVGALLASALPGVIWGRLAADGLHDPVWLPATIWLQVSGLNLLLLIAIVCPPASPLRLPLIMLLAFLVGWRVLTPFIMRSTAWAELQSAGQSVGMSLATSRLQWLPPATLMTLVAMGAGLSRAELFSVRGNWTAAVLTEPLLPLRGWRWFPGMFLLFPIVTIVTFVVVEFVLGMQGWVTSLGPDFDRPDRALRQLHGVVTGSVLNAAFEETIFRAMLLPCFIPVVGTRQACALTALVFALEHWPTAGIGIVLTWYSGWIFAKSMCETGGWTWATTQHVIADLPIYALAAMAK